MLIPAKAWAWSLLWIVPGQQPIMVPYYDSEDACKAAIVELVKDYPAGSQSVCSPLTTPEKMQLVHHRHTVHHRTRRR